jgi:hypothetical protein
LKRRRDVRAIEAKGRKGIIRVFLECRGEEKGEISE